MRKFLFAAVMAVAISGGAQAATIINGSFEMGTAPGSYSTLGFGSTAITGWTVTGGSIDYIGSLWTASDGSRSLDMAGNEAGTIAQAIDTIIGRTYRVTFDLAGNPQGGDALKNLSVSATGAGNSPGLESFSTAGKNETNMGWSPRSYTFTADSLSTMLSFTSLTTGVYGPALDNVAIADVTAVPEPATWAMMLGGVGIVGGMLRRRRSPAFVTA